MENSTNTHELSDEELILMMANNKQSLTAAKAEWGELYARHREFVFQVICKKSANWLGFDDEVRSGFVSEVFIKVYLKAETFKPQNLTDRDDASKLVRGWIGKIAERLLYDWGRKNKDILPLSYDDEKFQEEDEHTEESPLSQTYEPSPKVKRALEALTYNERQVLRAYAPYWKGLDVQLIIPDKELTELAQTLGTSKPNIRQIKKRVLDKIKRMAMEDSP